MKLLTQLQAVIPVGFICISLLTGCTTTREGISLEPEYLPPSPKKFETSVNLESKFEKSWEKTIAFLSEQDMTLNSADMTSGLIVAEKYFGNLVAEPRFYDPGMIKVNKTAIVETMQPYGVFGSGDPDYVRKYGKIVDRQKSTAEILAYRQEAVYPVTIRATIKLNRASPDITSAEVKLSILPRSNILETETPRPVSTGVFEARLFDRLRVP